MDLLEIKHIFDDIVNVRSNTQYWLIRTMGGDFFKEYITRGYVAIGYNEISLSEIKYAVSFGDNAGEMLKTIFETKEKLKKNQEDDEEVNSQYATTQLLKFYKEINVGDIIVMPGRNSDSVAIARVESDVYEEPNVSKLTGVCNFAKRRKITLLKRTCKTALNPKLQLMFNSRHIVSNANNYSNYIDNCISDFYQKDGCTNLVLRVKQEDNIKASDYGLIPELISLVSDFSEEQEFDIDVDDIKAKMCVQSPGDILLFAQSWEGITIIGMFIILLKGGELSLNTESGFKVKTGKISESVKDILHALNDFLDRRRDRKFKKALQRKLESMKIETPEDLAKVLKEFNDKRNPY